MPIELKIPTVGESITEVEIGDWLKSEGDHVDKDQNVVTIDSEKTTVELPSPEAGTLAKILKKRGETAAPGDVIALIETDGAAKKKENAPARNASPAPSAPRAKEAPPAPKKDSAGPSQPPKAATKPEPPSPKPTPAQAEREEATPRKTAETAPPVEARAPAEPAGAEQLSPIFNASQSTEARQEDIVPMSRLRRTLAQRLVAAQQNAALLTTFNEVDMSGVMALRGRYGDAFQKKFGVKLGLTSFFVKAATEALKAFPQINAEARGTDIVYRNYYDIGVAIGSGKGLVVPILRSAERMSFAEIEAAIGDFVQRLRENKLKPEELEGGTFTISNGGIYGSLLSTPIVNPPQSGILGMHAIQDRPVAREGQVVIRPMMYIALTYDHRIVDGREAVSFLKRIKEVIEEPARMLIEV